MTRTAVAVGVPVSARPFAQMGATLPVLKDQGSNVTVTASATPHSVGAWTELIASTSSDTDWITIILAGVGASGTDTRALVNIGLGAAASEVTVISSLPAGFSWSNGRALTFPLSIPKGTRISAQLQALIVSDTCTVRAMVGQNSGWGPRSPTRIVTHNANTSTSAATTYMTGNDTYAEIVTATTEPFAGLIATPCIGSSTNLFGHQNTLTLAGGASGSEIVFGVSTTANYDTNEVITFALGNWGGEVLYGKHVPAGTRLATKVANGGTHKGVLIFGIPYA